MRVHGHIWIVVRTNGEHHLLEKEPIEGIDAWAKGQDVTVIEYGFQKIRFPKGAIGNPEPPASPPPALSK